jgi:tetratricopeptide (TPR) repeat protein
MSSQSIWFAYDPQWATSIRARLNECHPSDLWLIEPAISNTTPHIIHDKYLGQPLRQQSSKQLLSTQYDPLNSEQQTIDTLNTYLEQQAWRSAIDWTTTYLLNHADDYHLWFIRLACLLKLRLFATIESELETFGNLNTYVKLPFSLRLLHAEVPIYMDNNRYHDGLDRLFRLLMMINTILSVLSKDQSALWHKRRLRVLYSICNCYVLMKRTDLIISLLENQIIKNESNEQQIELYLFIARLLLQTGDDVNGQRAFDRARALVTSNEQLTNEFQLTQQLFALFRNEFTSDTSITLTDHPIAVNNRCVLLLYMSKMKDTLDKYETYIRHQQQHIHEALIYNMCTIYELESFRFNEKKHHLIDFISEHVSDGFSLTALKLQN